MIMVFLDLAERCCLGTANTSKIGPKSEELRYVRDDFRCQSPDAKAFRPRQMQCSCRAFMLQNCSQNILWRRVLSFGMNCFARPRPLEGRDTRRERATVGLM